MAVVVEVAAEVAAEVVVVVGNRRSVDYSKDPIWLKIKSLEFDYKDVSLTFSERLASENRWAHWYALDVIEEYKKFLYIMAVSGHPVTPSVEIDQAWHLHLIYSRHYWEDFASFMPFKPHHGPTKGGGEENKKYNDWYSKTLESYASIFGTNAPVNIWPEPNIRFRSNQLWQWIDASKYFIISRSAGLILFAMVMLIFFMFIFLLIS